ncbi:M20 family metallopeptidase [Schaedlerella arabinosiphila]|uniref:M20 family metallopeptidase n=1 Tax=Schaedlerella arabinosiphila TaxID=2044587 RepID=UPI0025582BDB|nr:M20/M25/M40 family metallo-hydrolase [Schaedlerella arabinosiphila]
MDRETVFKILEKLIAINTANPPGNEKAAAEYLYELFCEEKISARIQDLGNNRANLTASYGNGEPEIIFCGHLDVVPAAEDWQFPPFQMTKKGERLYGRGTADMKGGVAAMCAVLLQLSRENIRLSGTLTLVLVADEECGNLGMRHFLREKGKAAFAVIGEPTELQVAVAHRGVLRDYVDIAAAPYHAALPLQQHNAMQDAAKAINAIFRMNEALVQYRHVLLPPPGIAVTMVEGYEKDNIVPGHVRLLTDFRVLPGMGYEECRRLEEQALEGIENCSLSKHFFMPGGEMDSGHALVKKCCEIGERVLGEPQSPAAFDASCEQCFLVGHGIPAVICGPGSLKQAHTSEEYVEEEQIRLAVKYYYQIAMEFLKGEESK